MAAERLTEPCKRIQVSPRSSVPPSFWSLCHHVPERRYSSQRESSLSPTRLRRKHNSCEQRPDCASKLRPPLEIRRRSSNGLLDMGSAISSLWQHESRRSMALKSSFATGMCRSFCWPNTLKKQYAHRISSSGGSERSCTGSVRGLAQAGR